MNTEYLKKEKVYLQDMQITGFARTYMFWAINFDNFLTRKYNQIAKKFGGGAKFCDWHEEFFEKLRNFEILEGDEESLENFDFLFVDEESYEEFQNLEIFISKKMPKIFVLQNKIEDFDIGFLNKAGYKIFTANFDGLNYFVGFLDKEVNFNFTFDDIKSNEYFTEAIFEKIAEVIFDNTYQYFQKLQKEIEE